MSSETVGALLSLVNFNRKRMELKKRPGQKLLRSRAPKHLWDNCLELEAYIAYIRSNTAHEICKLDGEVPKQ